MTHISKHPLSKATEKKLIDSLTLVFAAISQQDDMLSFLHAFFTKTEKLMLAKRLAIIVLLKENMTDGEIANALHVTRITVSKMRYFYEARGQKGYDIALSKIAADKRLQVYKKILISLARYSIQAAGGYVKPL